MELSWKDLNINRRIRVDRFNVYRAPANLEGGKLTCAEEWTRIAATPSPIMRYIDDTVANGAAYCYAVTAVNAKGESRKSIVANAQVPAR